MAARVAPPGTFFNEVVKSGGGRKKKPRFLERILERILGRILGRIVPSAAAVDVDYFAPD